MQILIAHISDIHIKTGKDPVLSRAESIARAIQSWCYDVSACVVAITGDVAYSGTEAQYLHAEVFFLEIEELLKKMLNDRGLDVPIVRVVVPGNHDCDFSELGQLRQLVLDKVASIDDIDDSIVEACTGPQDAFFAWIDPVARLGFSPLSPKLASRLGYSLTIEFDGGEVAFRCLNTAWVSQYHEQNNLSFPARYLPEGRSQAALVVALFHHPYGWMLPDSGRAFRKAIEGNVDVILTGHEHDPGKIRTETSRGASLNYLEGALLQDSSDEKTSSFNCLLLDTESRRQKFGVARWDGTLYVSEMPANWEPFRLNQARLDSQFVFSAKTEEFLSDPGLALTHEGTDQVTLSDIYVFPDLEEVGLPNAGKGETVRGDDVVAFIASRDRGILIAGDTQTGKTSLAKMLMGELRARGLVPVLVSATDCAYTGARLREAIEEAFVAQYESKSRTAYQQLDAAQRVVLVDDYDQLKVSKKNKRRWLEDLAAFAPRPVLMGHMTIVDIDDLIGSEGSVALDRYQIRPFGHRRRHKLIERWLMLGSTPETVDEISLVKTMAALNRTFDTLIGKNFVPAYPPYLLAVLQANQAAAPVDLKASTHGYFYELFIRTALAGGRTSVQYDIITAYLGHFAYELLLQRVRVLSLRQVDVVHRAYEKRHDIELSVLDTRRQLLEQRIWMQRGDEILFRYDYLYYYFVAAYLRDHLSDGDVRAQVVDLTRRLHVEENANILLFLAHLCKEPLIIVEMLASAKAQYAESSPVGFDEDVISGAKLRQLGNEVVVYKDSGDSAAHRERAMEALDEADDLEHEIARVAADPFHPIVRVGTMLKTLQILGQIVKNFPGSLDGSVKTDIVRECCELGLRAAGAVFAMVRTEQLELLQSFANLIKVTHPSFEDERIVERAKDTLVALTAMAGFGIVKRIALAVGSPELLHTYERVFDEDIPAKRLIGLSVQLDQFGTLPIAKLEKMNSDLGASHLASWIMRSLCVEYFNMFPIKPAEKQAVCRALGITYEQVGPSESGMLLRRSIKPLS